MKKNGLINDNKSYSHLPHRRSKRQSSILNSRLLPLCENSTLLITNPNPSTISQTYPNLPASTYSQQKSKISSLEGIKSVKVIFTDNLMIPLTKQADEVAICDSESESDAESDISIDDAVILCQPILIDPSPLPIIPNKQTRSSKFDSLTNNIINKSKKYRTPFSSMSHRRSKERSRDLAYSIIAACTDDKDQLRTKKMTYLKNNECLFRSCNNLVESIKFELQSIFDISFSSLIDHSDIELGNDTSTSTTAYEHTSTAISMLIGL